MIRRSLAILLVACGVFAAKPGLADPPPGFEYNTVVTLGAGTDLCNHIGGAFLQSWNQDYLGYGPGDKVVSPQRGQHDYAPHLGGSQAFTPQWLRVPWWDFQRAFPKRFHEMTLDGKHPSQDYNLRLMHIDLDSDNHPEDIYQILWTNGERFGEIFSTDDHPALNQALAAINPSYVIGYQGIYYPMSREKGSATVYRLASDHGKHNGAGPQIITAKMCEFSSNVSIEGTSNATTTTEPAGAPATYK